MSGSPRAGPGGTPGGEAVSVPGLWQKLHPQLQPQRAPAGTPRGHGGQVRGHGRHGRQVWGHGEQVQGHSRHGDTGGMGMGDRNRGHGWAVHMLLEVCEQKGFSFLQPSPAGKRFHGRKIWAVLRHICCLWDCPVSCSLLPLSRDVPLSDRSLVHSQPPGPFPPLSPARDDRCPDPAGLHQLRQNPR